MTEEKLNLQVEQLLSISRTFFVIDSSGILLYHEDFSDQDIDADLYAGLFSAVNIYAKELDAGNIKVATVEDHKFVFAENEDTGYLIVMDVEKQMTDDHGEWLLNQIISRFTKMQDLMADDIMGSLSLETLFGERGKTINWSTIHAIREGAIQTQKSLLDNVETLNLSKINLNNRLWVNIRTMVGSMVKNQSGLDGIILIVQKNNQLNSLFSGRKGVESLENLIKYTKDKLSNEIFIEIETENIKLDDTLCAIFSLSLEEGGLLAIASQDEFLIDRLTNQMERLVSSVERLARKF